MANLSPINGLLYLENYLTEQQEQALLQAIYAAKWLGDLQRRVQHYGYKYDYKARFVDVSMRIGELPIWGKMLAERLATDQIMDFAPDQLIVNEYVAGQGISHHVDCVPCFGDTIVSMSLGSDCVMDFIHKQTKEKIPVLLKRRSLVALKDEARYLWTHGISARKTDVFEGEKFVRNTRVSLTFRNVVLQNA